MSEPRSPRPSTAGRSSLRRAALWVAVATVLVVGLVFFFRFGREISPVLGGGQ